MDIRKPYLLLRRLLLGNIHFGWIYDQSGRPALFKSESTKRLPRPRPFYRKFLPLRPFRMIRYLPPQKLPQFNVLSRCALRMAGIGQASLVSSFSTNSLPNVNGRIHVHIHLQPAGKTPECLASAASPVYHPATRTGLTRMVRSHRYQPPTGPFCLVS